MPLSETTLDLNRKTTGVVLPEPVLNEVWQKATESSFVMAHARRMTIPATGTKVNIITGDPTPDWVEETHEKPVSKPTFANKTMTPYKMAVIVPFSNEFRRDLPTLYSAIVDRIPAALGRKFDQTCLFGEAPGANFDTLAGVDAVDIQAAPVDALSGAITAIGVAGGTADAIGLAPQGYGILTAAKNTDGSPTYLASYNSAGSITPFGLPVDVKTVLYSAGTPNTVGFVGDWTKAIYGVVQAVTMDLTEQATINDGTNSINLWQRNMFAVRCEMEVGFAIEGNEYFKRLTDTQA